jgi:RecB family exonuclease
MGELALSINPAAVEVNVEGSIAGIKVQGRLDRVEKSGRVRDVKTTSRKCTSISPEHRFQLATYTQLCAVATGEIVVDQLVRTKTPQLVTLTGTVKRIDIRATEQLYPIAQAAMRTGVLMPNRRSPLCSRKNCAFWRACEKEFGGAVEES